MTSIEWLKEKLWNEFNISFSDNIFEQAKEMHRQEILDAYATVITKYNGVKSWTKIHDEEAEEYYQSKFNGQDKTDK